MEMFPGRTLDELAGMDWPRLQRALEARRMSDVERKREWLMDKSGKAADRLDADDVAAIREHDDLYAEWQAIKHGE